MKSFYCAHEFYTFPDNGSNLTRQSANTLKTKITKSKNQVCVIKDKEYTEEIDLSCMEVDSKIEFQNCIFRKGIICSESNFKYGISFFGCLLDYFDGYGMQSGGDICFARNEDNQKFMAKRQVRLSNATIEGDLVFAGGVFKEGEFDSRCKRAKVRRAAIDAENISINGSLIFNDIKNLKSSVLNVCEFTSFGHVCFLSSTIKGKIYARRAKFLAGICINKPKPETIRGDIDTERSFVFVNFLWEYVFNKSNTHEREFDEKMEKERFDKIKELKPDDYNNIFQKYISSVISLDFYGSEIQGSIHFSYGMLSIGTIRLGGSTIGGKLSLKGSKLYELLPIADEDETAEPSGEKKRKNDLKNSQLRITQVMGKSIVYFGGTSYMPWGSLDASNITLSGSLYLCSLKKSNGNDHECGNFCSFGRVSFAGANIGGRVFCGGAHFFKSNDEFFRNEKSKRQAKEQLEKIRYTEALNLSHAKIDLELIFSNHSIILGRLNIDNLLSRGSVTFSNFTSISYKGDKVAITARNSIFQDTLEFKDSTMVIGCVNLNKITCASNVIFNSSIFSAYPVNGNSYHLSNNFNVEYADERQEDTHTEELILTHSENPTVRFFDLREDAGNLTTLINDSFNKSLAYKESWAERRDRQLNDSLAINLGLSTIGGNVYLSFFEENQDVRYSSLIIGKLNLIDATIHGLLRLDMSNIETFCEDYDWERSRFDFSSVFKPENKNLTSIATAINLSGCNCNAFSVNQSVYESTAFSIPGFEYKRLAGDAFQKTDAFNAIIGRSYGNYINQELATPYRGDYSSLKRIADYFKENGNYENSKDFQIYLHILSFQNICTQKWKSFTTLTLSLLIFICLIFTINFFKLMSEIPNQDQFFLFLSVILGLLAIGGIIHHMAVARKLLHNHQFNLSCKEGDLEHFIPFKKLPGYLALSLFNFGHSFTLIPFSIFFSIVFFSSYVFMICNENYLPPVYLGFKFCLPVVGLFTSTDEENLLCGLAGHDAEGFLRPVFFTTVILTKVLGWMILSLSIAGCIKLLKSKWAST